VTREQPDQAKPCFRETALITGSLLPWTGGPLRSIGFFQKALSANVISFIERRLIGDHALSLPDGQLTLVPSRPLPGFRHFLWPESSALSAARAVLQRASLASCHSFYTYHPVWMYRECRRLGLPYWIVPHGILDHYVSGRRRFAKQLYMSAFGRACLSQAAATVFSTHAERDKALRQFRLANPVVIPWPVATPPSVDRPAAQATLRQRLGLPAEARILLYLGRLHSMKRPLETIRLFAAAAKPMWYLVVVGHPEDVSEAACLEEAKSCHIGDRVRIVPGVAAADVPNFINGSSVFVSYSKRENFNNAAAECMAAGIPLLLSRGNDLVGEIGQSEALGIMTESSTEASAELRRWLMMTDRELCLRGQVARDWATSNLSFESFRNRLHDLRRATAGLDE
jgi:glycosyltransferase involved in cell wall biosynthesis